VHSDRLTESIVHLVETIGWEVRQVLHPSSLRLELAVSPPLMASRKDIVRMIKQLYTAPFWGSTIGNCFSTDHDCGMSYIHFRQEAILPNFPEHQTIMSRV
jgi:hypothetical protein